ncbi:MAG: hypothetical protein HYX90_11105 [Chloroflexi bacterium]|nr:hypothetical protein [Chloroflexota bacterium]
MSMVGSARIRRTPSWSTSSAFATIWLAVSLSWGLPRTGLAEFRPWLSMGCVRSPCPGWYLTKRSSCLPSAPMCCQRSELRSLASFSFTQTLFRQSDVVTIHLRFSDRTRGLIAAQELGWMRPTAFLVNTSRGPIVDETALIDALRRRAIAGAALDVFDREPLPADHPLLRLDNTVLTPHLGYCTWDTYKDFYYGQTVENILGFLRGEPKRMINPEVLARPGFRGHAPPG